MTPAFYIVPALLISVILLIRAELCGNRQHVYFFKPLATLLVIGMAALSFLQPAHHALFSTFVLIGLFFSFGGDVALMFQDNPKAFRLGLILFLLGHVAYTTIFAMYSSVSIYDVFSAAALLAVGILFYQLIKDNLGVMKTPVIVYMIVISLMVNRAVATMTNPFIATRHMQLIILGAVLFYISDVILAANRFWKPLRYNRISLGFYYAGQMFIALSASFF